MSSPLQGSLEKTIGKALSGLFYDATLTRTVTTGANPFDPASSGSAVSTDYACKAMEDTFSKFEIANSLVGANDVKVIILASTLSVTPTTEDTITIGDATYAILNVARDPAQATFTIQARVE